MEFRYRPGESIFRGLLLIHLMNYKPSRLVRQTSIQTESSSLKERRREKMNSKKLILTQKSLMAESGITEIPILSIMKAWSRNPLTSSNRTTHQPWTRPRFRTTQLVSGCQLPSKWPRVKRSRSSKAALNRRVPRKSTFTRSWKSKRARPTTSTPTEAQLEFSWIHTTMNIFPKLRWCHSARRLSLDRSSTHCHRGWDYWANPQSAVHLVL